MTLNQPFELPDWMQPHRRALDWGLVLVAALSLAAAMPFLLNPGLPRETDAELHVFRTAELGRAITQGVLYPRWAANFWYGYGYPFFNYYGSLTYYLAAGFGLLTGAGPVEGARTVFILGIVLAGVGTYAFVRRRWNAHAGVVAGVVYAFSPYVMLIDPHMRGDMAEAFALAVFPGVLWTFDRVLAEGQGRHLAAAALLLAALILTHNLMALIFFALLAGWLAWLRVFTRPGASNNWVRVLLAILLGLGVAGLFWIPVLLEYDEVQLHRLTGPGHFDYRNHFLGLGELLRPSPPLDLGAANPAYAFNFGVAAWTLALVGGAALLAQRQRSEPPLQPRTATADEWRRLLMSGALEEALPPPGGITDVAYFGVAALVLTFLMLPISDTVWSAPGMPIIQFPWRLLGPTALCLAVVAGAATRWLRYLPSASRPLGLGALVAIPLVTSITACYPPEWEPDFGETTPQAYLAFELSGAAVGTTAGGEFLPDEVLVPPGPQTTLIESYAGSGPIDKVNRTTLPAQTRVDILYHGPTEDRFLVRTREAFPLRLFTFAFAGWRAEIDSRPVEIEVAAPEGFVVVNVPAGAHDVRVYLGATPARSLGDAVTITAGIALAVTASILKPRQSPAASPHLLGRRSALAALAVGALFAGFKLLSDAQPGLFYSRSEPGTVAGMQYAYRQLFTGNIELLGYDLPAQPVHPGATLPVTLYWRATGPVTENDQVFVHLIPLGARTPAAQSDKLNPGDYPTTRWSPARYVRDAHAIDLPADLAPGQYLVAAGLYNLETGVRVQTLGANPDDKAVLPTFVEIVP